MRRLLLLLVVAVGCETLNPAGIRFHNTPTLDDGALHIVNFDVGQADALLVLYKGKSLLVDCGSPVQDPLRASRRIPRRLDALLGKREIDYFVITHYHRDHMGAPKSRNQRVPLGIFSLLERDGVRIKTLYDRGFWFLGPKGGTQKRYEQTVQQWIDLGFVGKREALRPGDKIDMGEGLEVKVVASAGNGALDRLYTLFPSFVTEHKPSENDYSIALTLRFGEFEMFTAGDLSGHNVVRQYGPKTESYNDMESRIAPRVGGVEVYRVNHHGSRHSSNECFVNTLRPQVSVFSTGPNSYGHPSMQVVNRVAPYGDLFVTGGADRRVYESVKQYIVGDDVEIVVHPSGERFWVNGKEYHSNTDAQEIARHETLPECEEYAELSPDQYKIEKDKNTYAD